MAQVYYSDHKRHVRLHIPSHTKFLYEDVHQITPVCSIPKPAAFAFV